MNDILQSMAKQLIPFLPVLFGAVEFIKDKTGLKGPAVEAVAAGLATLFGSLVLLSHYAPDTGTDIAASVIFLIMCILAPSGYYKFLKQ